MNPTITCKFCASTDVPADLECIRMCGRCCSNGVDAVVHERGWVWTWMTKRVLRRQREIREEMAADDAEMRAWIEGR